MENYDSFSGYKPSFMGSEVSLPQLDERQAADLVAIEGKQETVLHYINYSLQLSKSRQFPFYTATNIDGYNFKKAPRKDAWRTDSRIPEDCQWGPELYKAAKSDFDRGHMTKREDVQWGNSIAIASKAADSTFFYTNAVPQMAQLNQEIWRSLEDYILHTEARYHELKISVFTGPVLSKNDPWFITTVQGSKVQLPALFWKVVYYHNRQGIMSRAGFLMSQSSLLFRHGIVEDGIRESVKKADSEQEEYFMDFDHAATYQVNIALIEKLTGLIMASAGDSYTDERPIELVLQEIDVRESLKESANILEQIGFDINGIQL